MKTLFLLFLALVATSSFSFALDCGDGKVRGVNIGGLFLLEPWITPVLFEDANALLEVTDVVVDEWTFAENMDPDVAADILDQHWDTFYSQQDLQELFDSGITHVRLPLGYWLIDVAEDEPFPPPPATDNDGQRFYVKRFLSWCEEVGLKVLIDLHGAPGSQNGFDNSGKRGDVEWYTSDGDTTNADRTTDILDQLTNLILDWVAEGTISPSTIYGIDILNEPAGWDEDLWEFLRDEWHYEVYSRIYPSLLTLQPENQNPMFIMQQAFRPHTDWVDYMNDYLNAGVDFHEYHAFTQEWNDLALDPEGWQANLDAACGFANNMEIQTLTAFTGEWSLAITDCQEYLNGGYVTPYDPPLASDETCEVYNSDFSTFTDEYKDFLRDFMLAQMNAFEQGDGYFFWTAKTEDNCAPEWDYLFLLQNGIAPPNLCERDTYCSF